MPVSGVLFPQYRQKGLGTLDACSLLIVKQDMWDSSTMKRGIPGFSDNRLYAVVTDRGNLCAGCRTIELKRTGVLRGLSE
jgi:hypothetical protein